MSKFNQPLYLKIYSYIADSIKSGKYQNGDRIPSEKELAEEFKVSRITSKKALVMLADNNLIKRMPGKGSFVSIDDETKEYNKEVCSETKANDKLIGLIMPDFSDTYGTGLLSGIESEATKNGYFIIPQRSYGRQDAEEKVIEALIELGVNGIIIMPVHGEHYNPKILRLVLDDFPIVLLDRDLKGIPAPFVGSDNIGAAKKATDYLLGLGHKNISFISPPAVDTSTIEARIEGFVKSHAEHGVAVDESIWVTNLISTLPGNNEKANISIDIENLRNTIKSNNNITCLLAVEYNIALIAVEAVKSLGMKIPEDISILCFDGPTNYVGEYFITHIRQRETEMGVTAFKLLLNQINSNGQDAINSKVLLDTDLIIGTSTKSKEI